MSKMKKYIIIGGAVILALLLSCLYYQHRQIKRLNSLWSKATIENKALTSDMDSIKSSTVAHEWSINELYNHKDSISQHIVSLAGEKNIKKKNIAGTGFIQSKASRTDTITVRDTIFRDTIFRDSLCLDTTIHNKWYSLNLKLNYPSQVIVTPSFISNKYVIISYKKETIQTPSRWWIVRLFQKKHKVIRVEVKEENPYIVTTNTKFIKIVK